MYNINYSFETYSTPSNAIMKRKAGKWNIYYLDYISTFVYNTVYNTVYELHSKNDPREHVQV